MLFLYYLKEHDFDNGRYKLIAKVGRAPIVTYLRTNDRGWKDRYLFVRGDLVWGLRGPGGVQDELNGEKAVSAGLRAELEEAAEKVQTIAVDAVLSARAELMGEFKRGEHSSWDPDEEIETWRKREAVLAGAESASDGEASEEEGAPAVESPEQQEAEVVPELGEPADGAEDAVPEQQVAPAHEDPAASAEDIARD